MRTFAPSRDPPLDPGLAAADHPPIDQLPQHLGEGGGHARLDQAAQTRDQLGEAARGQDPGHLGHQRRGPGFDPLGQQSRDDRQAGDRRLLDRRDEGYQLGAADRPDRVWPVCIPSCVAVASPARQSLPSVCNAQSWSACQCVADAATGRAGSRTREGAVRGAAGYAGLPATLPGTGGGLKAVNEALAGIEATRVVLVTTRRWPVAGGRCTGGNISEDLCRTWFSLANDRRWRYKVGKGCGGLPAGCRVWPVPLDASIDKVVPPWTPPELAQRRTR